MHTWPNPAVVIWCENREKYEHDQFPGLQESSKKPSIAGIY